MFDHRFIRLDDRSKMRIEGTLTRFLEGREEVIFAYLHGGFADALAFRDVDIAIYTQEGTVSEKESLDYEIRLSTILENEVHVPVDVRLLNFAPLSFKYHAIRGRLIISRDDEARYRFVEDTCRDYFDMEPHFKTYLKDLLQST